MWNSRRVISALVLGAAILLQLSDLDFRRSILRRTPPQLRPLQGALWEGLHREYEHLSIFPVQARWVCPYHEPLVNRLVYLAYRQRMTINSGYVSRVPEAIGARCFDRMGPGGLDDRTVYFPRAEAFPDFTAAGATCGTLDGLAVCVSGRRETNLRNVLRDRPGP
jgi:hypothetical protein